jgi:OmcA/MtrC family decaheme c-type cytochrome
MAIGMTGLLIGLAGCEGDTGPAGPAGADGQPGADGTPGSIPLPTTDEVSDLVATITNVTIASEPVVQFTLEDGNGNPVVLPAGFRASNFGFIIAKLIPGPAPLADSWQSYINEVEEAGVGPWPGTEDTIHAARERPSAIVAAGDASAGNPGVLVDNGDGTFAYTFSFDIANVVDPIAVPYDATLTHQVSFQMGGVPAELLNPVYTFRPSDGATTGILTRNMIDTSNCNVCHNGLAFHGGSRREVGFCVLCHNPGTVDAQSTNTVDFKVMVHKLHRGSSLNVLPYQIWGHNNSLHDYSGVVFPRDVRNCTTCHDDSNASTPDAKNWRERPSMEACGSCHDNVDFVTGAGHGAGNVPATNSDCQVCHRPGSFVGSIEDAHRLLAQEEAEKFQYNILGVANTAPGDTPSITFSVTDPSNANAPYDILDPADPRFQPAGGSRRVNIDVAWSTTDYRNTGSGSDVPGFRPGVAAQPFEIDVLSNAVPGANAGEFVVTAPALPANATGSIAVALEGHPAGDLDGDGTFSDRIPVGGEVEYFASTDTTVTPRRVNASIDKCNGCHAQLSLHGNNRTDKIELCVLCHNPNATDIRARTEGGVDATTSADGLDEESIDFKRMIHRIHAGNVVVYGFGGGVHDYREVVFPGKLNDCTACHSGQSYYPVTASTVLATTIDTGADLADPSDDINITANAAVCSSCHTSTLAKAHMEQNGGSFSATQDDAGNLTNAGLETCAICHGPGHTADVAVMHGIGN